MLTRTIASLAIILPLAIPSQAIAGTVHTIASTKHARSVAPSAADRKQLKKILRQHVWRGGGVSRGVRAAAGDSTMAVIDRRQVWGETYQCSFITYSGKRAMTCN